MNTIDLSSMSSAPVPTKDRLHRNVATVNEREKNPTQTPVNFLNVPPSEFTRDTVESDSGDVIAAELSHFGSPLSEIPLRVRLKIGVKLVWESLQLGASIAGSTVLNNLANILLNRNGSVTEQAAMGTALAFNRWFYYGITQAMFEKFGIDWSRSYGAKQYHLTKVYFYQALIVLFTTFALITLPGYLFSEEILLAVGTTRELASGVGVILQLLMLADTIEALVDLLQYFVAAQGHESLFGALTIISLGPSVFAAYYFVEVLKLGAVGWVYSKMVYDGINLLVSAVVMVRVSHPQTWGKVSISAVTTGLADNFVDSFKYALGSYTEFLGYMIGDYFVILTHDENQIAAFTIVMNIGSMLYCLGEAFATIMRTRMNILIGKRDNDRAKNFTMFYFLLLAGFSAFLMMVVWILREKIVGVYTDRTPELSRLFVTMIILQVMFLPLDIMLSSVGIVMKTLGLVQLFVTWSFTCFVIINGAICLVLYLLGLMSAAVAYVALSTPTYLVIGMSIYKSLAVDWSKIELQDDEEDRSEAGVLLDDRSWQQPRSLG